VGEGAAGSSRGGAARVLSAFQTLILGSARDVIIGGAIAAGVGVLASIVATIGQGWLARRARDAEYRITAIRQSAPGYGKTRSLLRDMQPDPLIGHSEAPRATLELWERAAEAQDELEILAAAHPSDSVGQPPTP
jgi:hypothetical protein